MAGPASASTSRPVTGSELATQLRHLGMGQGDVVLVQSSLRSIGRVDGGAKTVVQALLDVVGPAGTLVVPTYTAGNCDPSRWALTRKRPVPPEQWQSLRDRMPAFDPARTPAEGVGVIAETVRTWPGAVRSAHPQTSFAAVGPVAAALMAGHPRACHLGPRSPLGRLAEHHAQVLLLGVRFEVCTAFHLAEYLVPDPPVRSYECVVRTAGRRHWFRYQDIVLDDRDFGRLGTALEAAPVGRLVRRGTVGGADSRRVPLAAAVEYARRWLIAHRTGGRVAGSVTTR
ncbi:MAG TPA: AAC(3) family N-acetyltransferase [Kineosporiaceae bacterium]